MHTLNLLRRSSVLFPEFPPFFGGIGVLSHRGKGMTTCVFGVSRRDGGAICLCVDTCVLFLSPFVLLFHVFFVSQILHLCVCC